MSDLASRLLLQLKDYGKCNDELAVSVKKTILEPFQVDLNRPESARKPPTTSKFKQMATQLAPIAMRIVNQNIDGLLNLKRTIKETGRYTIAVNCLLDTSFYALTALRHMNTYTALKPLDIEKATSNLICKMVELGEYQRAIDELRKFRVLLAGIAKVQLNPKSTVIVIDNRQRRGVLTESNCCVSQPKTTSDIPESMIQSQWEQDMLKDCQDLFQFPLDTSINDRTMMLLVLAYQMNTIRSWCEIKEGSLVKYVPYFLERPGSFLDWCKHLLQLDSTTAKKQLDTLYKLLYKATNRLPVSEESAFHSYHLQIFSLKALLLAGSTSLQSIMDRLVVIGTTYEKATQQGKLKERKKEKKDFFIRH
ncbi:hypothetical protein BD560DRAFT_331947 [Blakeslea trispora]|nr:hypothetical protein BD560DRAFT_331947 [Blakeslea trispora]